jgi:2-polyprenyl-3-methyl-5-hydroxy-6-metoxy-1,4-benzoquinol methylase
MQLFNQFKNTRGTVNNLKSEQPGRGVTELIKAESHLNRDRLRQLVETVNNNGGTYHQLNLGAGLILQGYYDMTKYIGYYELAASLEGKTVLDIGTASGYFALECARRGARVTAIDIYEAPLLMGILELVDVDIRYVQKSIYDLDARFGLFDLVVCGSLLLHLPDQFGAIQRIRSVCSGRAVVSTACTADSESNPRPLCEFIGQKATDDDYYAYWTLGAAALKHMMVTAGFSQVENQNHFILSSEADRTTYATSHVVMAGIV